MPFIEQLGMQAAQDATASALGLVTAGINDKRQLKQQGKLQQMQIQGSKEMTDYNMIKQLEMWKNTGYGPQKEMMKEAGLNPALMYGMSGGGGQSTGNANGNVSGGTAPAGGREIMDLMGQTAQRALLEAQRKNIEADTKNKEAQTAKTAGVDTTKTSTETQSLLQGIENAKAQKELTEIQTQNQEIENDIKGATSNAAKALVMQEMRNSFERMEIMKNEGTISEETMNAKIGIVKQELVGAYARNELTRSQAGKTKAETDQLAKTIALEYDKLSNEKDKTVIAKKLQEFQTSYGNQAGQILNSILGLRK